jgi:hypothetical protein
VAARGPQIQVALTTDQAVRRGFERDAALHRQLVRLVEQASGFGKDMSTCSFDEYSQVEHVVSALSRQPRKDWHDVIFTSPGEEHEHSRVITA